MYQILRSSAFDKWLKGLKDKKALARVLARIRSLELGNLGDCKPIKAGVWELRIHHGSGYRIYYMQNGPIAYLLLVGGVKSTQKKDIQEAVLMANEMKKELER